MRIYQVDDGGTARFAEADEAGQLQLLSDAPYLGGRRLGRARPLAGATLLAPVVPSKIVCVGRNYAAHAKELGNELPAEPLLFLKPPSALIGPGAAIRLPAMSERVEHEGEIGVVMGRRLTAASPAEARAAVFGVTCVNDVTARDLQRKDVQFTRAKSFDTFCPVGPCVVQGLDLEDLAVKCWVNGTLRQHGFTRDMAFPIALLVSFISQVMTLEPGDLISTGTPEGVGPLARGDRTVVEIEAVGRLENPVA